MKFLSLILVFGMALASLASANDDATVARGVIVKQGIVCGNGKTPSEASSGLMGFLYMVPLTSSTGTLYVNGNDLTGKPMTGFYQVKFPVAVSGLTINAVQDYFEACALITSIPATESSTGTSSKQ